MNHFIWFVRAYTSVKGGLRTDQIGLITIYTPRGVIKTRNIDTNEFNSMLNISISPNTMPRIHATASGECVMAFFIGISYFVPDVFQL